MILSIKDLLTLLLLLPILNPLIGQNDSIARQELLNRIEESIQRTKLEEARKQLDSLYAIYEEEQMNPDQLYLHAVMSEVKYWDRMGIYDSCFVKLDYATDLLDLVPNPKFWSRYNIMHTTAATHSRKGRFEEALVWAKKAFALAKSRDTIDRATINAYNILGTCYFSLYNIEKSITLLDTLIDLIKVVYPDKIILSYALSNQANNYLSLKQYDAALSYLHKSREVLQKIDGPDAWEMQRLCYLIGLNLHRKGDYEEAIKYLRDAIRIIELHQPGHHFIGEDLRLIGECKKAMGNPSAALKDFEQALIVYYDRNQHENFMVARVYHSLAKAYDEAGNYSIASDYYQRAASHSENRLGSRHPNVSTFVRANAVMQARLGNIEAAKVIIKKCVNNLISFQTQFEKPYDVAKKHLYQAYLASSRIYLCAYRTGHGIKELDTALLDVERCLSVINLLRTEMMEEAEKIELGTEITFVCAQGIEVAHLLYRETGEQKYAHKALEFSELSRRSTLLDVLISRSGTGNFAISKPMRLREKTLARKKAQIEGKLIELLATEAADSSTKLFEDSLFTLRSQIFDFQDSCKALYPQYYQVMYQRDQVSIPDIQSELGQDEGIVEYFDTDSNIYIFALTADRLNIRRLPKDDDLVAKLDLFQLHLSNPDTILADVEESQEKLARFGHQLYLKFLEHELAFLSRRNLIIIPDGLEAKLVFDMLIEAKVGRSSPETWPFVFRKYDLQYAASIQTWRRQKRIVRQASKPFLGFAPSYKSSDAARIDQDEKQLVALISRAGNLTLPNSAAEVTFIRDITGGSICIADAASERNFVQLSGNRKILHLSAHALLDDRFPERNRFLFTDSRDSLFDDQLTALEICQLDLDAELAVLSACHTGSGKINRGEGVMSLGRAFAFAGVPATVQSLWKIPDETTARVMPAFYAGLKKGMKKHAALNYARAQYLNHTEIKEQLHPHFWAGFILYGNADPVVFRRNGSWGIVGIILLLLVVGFLFLRKNSFFTI